MITLDCEQGSPEWLKARLGIPTMSRLIDIVTPTFKPSKSANSYMGELLAEYVTGEMAEFIETKDIIRGKELESNARKMYSAMIGKPVNEVGMVYFDERKDRACSPDGLVDNISGWEAKCPKLKNHIGYVLNDVLPGKYAPQVHGSMYITNLDRWDFMSYHPEYRPLIVTVERDEKIDKEIGIALDNFCDKLSDEKAKIDASRMIF